MNNTPMIPLSQKARRYGAILLMLLYAMPCAYAANVPSENGDNSQTDTNEKSGNVKPTELTLQSNFVPGDYLDHFVKFADKGKVDTEFKNITSKTSKAVYKTSQAEILAALQGMDFLIEYNEVEDKDREQEATTLLGKKYFVDAKYGLPSLRALMNSVRTAVDDAASADGEKAFVFPVPFLIGDAVAKEGKEDEVEKEKQKDKLIMSPGSAFVNKCIEKILAKEGALGKFTIFNWTWRHRETKNATLLATYNLLSTPEFRAELKVEMKARRGKDKDKKIYKHSSVLTDRLVAHPYESEDVGRAIFYTGVGCLLIAGVTYGASKLIGKSEGEEDEDEEDDETGEDEGEEEEEVEGESF